VERWRKREKERERGGVVSLRREIQPMLPSGRMAEKEGINAAKRTGGKGEPYRSVVDRSAYEPTP